MTRTLDCAQKVKAACIGSPCLQQYVSRCVCMKEWADDVSEPSSTVVQRKLTVRVCAHLSTNPVNYFNNKSSDFLFACLSIYICIYSSVQRMVEVTYSALYPSCF
jgi:hypothetical protein